MGAMMTRLTMSFFALSLKKNGTVYKHEIIQKPSIKKTSEYLFVKSMFLFNYKCVVKRKRQGNDGFGNRAERHKNNRVPNLKFFKII